MYTYRENFKSITHLTRLSQLLVLTWKPHIGTLIRTIKWPNKALSNRLVMHWNLANKFLVLLNSKRLRHSLQGIIIYRRMHNKKYYLNTEELTIVTNENGWAVGHRPYNNTIEQLRKSEKMDQSSETSSLNVHKISAETNLQLK